MPAYWEPQKPDKRLWQPLLTVKYFFVVRQIITLICIFAVVAGLTLLGIQMRTIPEIRLVLPDQAVLWTDTEPFVMTGEMVDVFMSEVLTALYSRTEQGRVVKDLSSSVDGVILELIDRPFEEQKTPFVVSLVVMDSKLRAGAQASFKTLVTSKSEKEYKASLVYFDTKWVRTEPTKDNPLGWMLSGLAISTESMFNRDEILQEVKEKTALVSELPLVGSLENKDGQEVGKTPSPTKGGASSDSQTTVAVPDLGAE